MGAVDEHGIEDLGDITLHGRQLFEASRLPCGCVIGNELATRAFVIEPCSLDCVNYRYSLAQIRAQGKSLVMDDRSRQN